MSAFADRMAVVSEEDSPMRSARRRGEVDPIIALIVMIVMIGLVAIFGARPTKPVEVTSGGGAEATGVYEVHVVSIGLALNDAKAVQKALAAWLAEHRAVRVVSIVPISNGDGVSSLVVLAHREAEVSTK